MVAENINYVPLSYTVFYTRQNRARPATEPVSGNR
jgi:hypothetical protein